MEVNDSIDFDDAFPESEYVSREEYSKMKERIESVELAYFGRVINKGECYDNF